MRFQMTMATLIGASLTEMRGQLKAITIVMGITSPVHAGGTRRADTVAFPAAPSRIEEV